MAETARRAAAEPPFRHVLIVGTGLLGASLGLALRRANAAGTVSGWDRSPHHLDVALRRGAIDAGRIDLDAAGADLIVLATPVGPMPELLARLALSAESGAVFTDVGSVKAPVMAAAASLPAAAVFVGGHPMAGKSEAGPAAADADLFRGTRWVLCPDRENPKSMAAAERLAALIARLGAEPVLHEAARHDWQVGAVSHLPQVASSALALAGAAVLVGDPADTATDPAADTGGFSLAAGGWRDMTRLAASDPEMWRDICLANRPALTAALAQYAAQLERFAAAVASGDGDALTGLFRAAQQAKQRETAVTTAATAAAQADDPVEVAS